MPKPEKILGDFFDIARRGDVLAKIGLDRVDFVANERVINTATGGTWFVNSHDVGISRKFNVTEYSQIDSPLREAGLSDYKGNYCYIRHQAGENYSYSESELMQETIQLSAVFIMRCKNIVDIMRYVVMLMAKSQYFEGFDLNFVEQDIISSETGKQNLPYNEDNIKLAKLDFTLSYPIDDCFKELNCELC